MSKLVPQRVLVLDRDGVINKKATKARYVTSWDEFEWVPGVKEALRILKDAEYTVIVATNQAGIGRGVLTPNSLADIHDRMRKEVLEAGGEIAAIYICPHSPVEGCSCRKPKPGLLLKSQRDYGFNPECTYLIGDDQTDFDAAKAAGMPWLAVDESTSLADHVMRLVSRGPATAT